MKKRLVSVVMAAMLSATSMSPVVSVVSADDQFEETAVVMEEVEEAAAEDYTAEESYEEETAYEEVSEEASDYTDEAGEVPEVAADIEEEETGTPEPASDYVEEEVQTSESVSDFVEEETETVRAADDYVDSNAEISDEVSREDEAVNGEDPADEITDEAVVENGNGSVMESLQTEAVKMEFESATEEEGDASVDEETNPNHLSVSIVDTAGAIAQTVGVEYGGSINLGIVVNADDMEGIHIEWFDSYKDDAKPFDRDTIGTTVSNVTERKSVRAEVTDKFGHMEYVTFEIVIASDLVVATDKDFKNTKKNIYVYNAPLVLKAYAKCSTKKTFRYDWYSDTFGDLGDGQEITIGLDILKKMAPGQKDIIRCVTSDNYSNFKRAEFHVRMMGILSFDKKELSLGLMKTGTVNATILDSDEIVKVVPADKDVATATWEGSKIKVRAGMKSGSTNIAVRTESDRVVKFRVTVPKPVLSFTKGGKTLNLKNGLSVNKGKSAAVAVKLANGDSIAKIVPSNSKVSCTWSGSRITVKGGKTAGTVNVAVKTKCGKIAKFKVVVK